MPADTQRNEKRRWRVLSIVAGFFIGFVFYFVSWFVLVKGLHLSVAQFFPSFACFPYNWQFWTWLLLMVYIGEWIVYFLVSSKIKFKELLYFFCFALLVYILLWLWLLLFGLQHLDFSQHVCFWLTFLFLIVIMFSLFKVRDNIWTLRWFVGHYFDQYLNGAGETKLEKIREKANVTKQTVAVLLSLSGVVVSIYILGWLSELPFNSYQEVFFYFTGFALISALVPLFVSLEALDTVANPFFDDGLMLKQSLKRLYNRGTRYYLIGLACFMFSLLSGLAIVNVFICFFGTVFFFVLTFLFHNYRRIDDPNRV